ncbi:D-alanyl-D-alanine carboxypeptidase/D-alanyl-D-alanine-endopeptidase [Amycolatopsis antarctica]|uniref:D-alanyl-D-alanine carboxypeptidase/D-alanyl-D-alanine-endopeptidase n=1 Tax=Amycolatopsis antarctica TaxID=1854586 RepID=A0A263DAZ9_9PSEU|nr:D-alanyl-D-alanine carboxypeptidase/D-alanyl-D-alanine-endopeptidase [Amycolatopsis antarctica]OZM74666.1 D-alanyl-D-alanine carboxypeptidase/D-alanyl-D-alanine-endopeptidase [Amycolatopsis antarctica]
MSLSRTGRAILATTLLAVLLTVPVGSPTAEVGNPLGQDIDAILADPALTGADIGLVVRRAADGEVLYDRQSDRRRQPASNGKLLTAAAALETLGPEHRFRTTVETAGTRSDGVLSGDLFLRGGGDPTMLAADYDGLAAQVADAGIRTVTGELVADDTYFDDVRLGLGWAWDDEPYYYNPQTSALTIAPDRDFDAGSIIVRVRPGTDGAPATVETEPPTGYVTLVNEATTTAEGGTPEITVDRAHGGNTVTVSGSIPAGADPVEEYIAVWEPTGLAASVFRERLAAHGVEVVRDTVGRATPGSATVLAEHRSMPVAELLTPFLKLSNNSHAEALVKTAGRESGGEGSWQSGLDAMAKTLPALGIDPAMTSIVDGSGLSRMDQLTPSQLASLLLAARGEPWFDRFQAALPVAGAADRLVGGTLRSRMVGTPAEGKVRAKTGSYTGVSSLSGYVTAAGGEELVFSLVANQVLGGSPRAVEDAVAIRLAEYTGPGEARRPAGLPLPRDADPAPELECAWTKSC